MVPSGTDRNLNNLTTKTAHVCEGKKHPQSHEGGAVNKDDKTTRSTFVRTRWKTTIDLTGNWLPPGCGRRRRRSIPSPPAMVRPSAARAATQGGRAGGAPHSPRFLPRGGTISSLFLFLTSLFSFAQRRMKPLHARCAPPCLSSFSFSVIDSSSPSIVHRCMYVQSRSPSARAEPGVCFVAGMSPPDLLAGQAGRRSGEGRRR